MLSTGVAFVLFPFISRLSMVGGFVCLVFVAVSGASAIGPKTAIVHHVTAGPAQVVGMPLYNRWVLSWRQRALLRGFAERLPPTCGIGSRTGAAYARTLLKCHSAV
jgi:hypothetical protein